VGRVSQEQALQNRQRVVATASKLFREKGTHGVGVADLMKAAGLTHGGFYKQFDSKDALIGEAAAYAFAEQETRHTARLAEHEGRPDAARRAVIDSYLSARHRDNAADGCPVAALAADMAHEPDEATAHRVYAEGVREFARQLSTDTDDGMARLCTMVGALVLARAVRDTPLSDDILRTAHAAVSDSA
jgi:TetR/AcrR family transcriptional repressor of nem operon